MSVSTLPQPLLPNVSLPVVAQTESLETTLACLLRCLVALDAYEGQGANIGAPSTRARPRGIGQQRSQQSAALLVVQAVPSYVRAVGAQRADSLKATLHRSIYLLVHTYQEHICSIRLPSELQMRLDLFVKEHA